MTSKKTKMKRKALPPGVRISEGEYIELLNSYENERGFAKMPEKQAEKKGAEKKQED